MPSFIQQSSFTNNQYHNHHQDHDQGNDDDLNPDQDQLLVLAGPSCSDQRCPQRLIPALPKSPISSISRPSAIIIVTTITIVTTIVITIVIITTTNEVQVVILAAEAQSCNPTSGGVLFPSVFFSIENANNLPILTHFRLFCCKFTHFLVHLNRLRWCTKILTNKRYGTWPMATPFH